MKLATLFFNVVPLDCNTLNLLSLQWSYTLRKKWNILGVKIPCYSFLDCIVIGKSSPMQKIFNVSEEKVVTRSQVWTVGRMINFYGATFPYSNPRWAWLVCGWNVMKQQDTSRQLSTAFLFNILAQNHYCGCIGVSSNGVLCGMNSKSTFWVPKKLLPWSFRLIVAHKIFWEYCRGLLVYPLHALLFGLLTMMIQINK